MGLEGLVGDVLVVGGTIYVVDKLTGKKKRVKLPNRKLPLRAVKAAKTSRRTVKIPRKSGATKRSNIRKAVRRSPPKRSKNKK